MKIEIQRVVDMIKHQDQSVESVLSQPYVWDNSVTNIRLGQTYFVNPVSIYR